MGEAQQGFDQSLSCHQNAFCQPQYCNERRSVVLILKSDNNGGFERLGTGFLVNNEKGDGTPYVITALHLADRDGSSENTISQSDFDEVEKFKFIFNYQYSECSPAAIVEPSLLEFVVGCEVISYNELGSFAYGNKIGDWILLKLNDRLPKSFNVFLSGFDMTTDKPSNVFSIHHPAVDVKKISNDFDKPNKDNYAWHVKNWTWGFIEGGSSGSPLYNERKLAVGVLSQSSNVSCGQNIDSYYSRLDKAWDSNSDNNKQLEHWLSPNSDANLSLSAISGIDPCKTSINFENANDLHSSDNVNIFSNFPSSVSQYGTRSYDGVILPLVKLLQATTLKLFQILR